MPRIHCLQHTATEGPGGVARWAERRGHPMATTRLDLGDPLPAPDSFDALVVMGGPMNIYQDRDYPWLKAERAFLREALGAGKKIVGFCLGSQLLADALGGRVHQHDCHEIGWFPVRKLPAASGPSGWGLFPEKLTVLHWHGDSFDLPAEARLLASSEACAHQAFAYQDQAVGFQFHLEVAEEDLKDFIGCGSDLKLPGAHVQNEGQIWEGARQHADLAQTVLTGFLDQFLG